MVFLFNLHFRFTPTNAIVCGILMQVSTMKLCCSLFYAIAYNFIIKTRHLVVCVPAALWGLSWRKQLSSWTGLYCIHSFNFVRPCKIIYVLSAYHHCHCFAWAESSTASPCDRVDSSAWTSGVFFLSLSPHYFTMWITTGLLRPVTSSLHNNV